MTFEGPDGLRSLSLFERADPPLLGSRKTRNLPVDALALFFCLGFLATIQLVFLSSDLVPCQDHKKRNAGDVPALQDKEKTNEKQVTAGGGNEKQ